MVRWTVSGTLHHAHGSLHFSFLALCAESVSLSESIGGRMESSAAASYAHLLDKTRLPQPSFQRLAVASLFKKLRSAPPPLGLASGPARDALCRCLSSPSAPVADQAVRELCSLVKDGLLPAPAALLELQSALDGCTPGFASLFIKGIGFLARFAFRADPSWGRRFDPVELHPFIKVAPMLEPVTLYRHSLLPLLCRIFLGDPASSNPNPNLSSPRKIGIQE
ncbi:hypothetical protein BHE74_00041734 [Ensete ventricosum]|nr:hypothetical protein BHE74_00041734 [Ensete ventricosum]